MEETQTDIIVKGEDYKNKRVSGVKFIKKYGGRLKLIKLYKNYSTSEIIKKKHNFYAK